MRNELRVVAVVVKLAFATVVTLLGASCASVQMGTGAKIEGAVVELEPSLSEEVLKLTAELIRTQAVNPPGNEAKSVRILQQRLVSAGITVEVDTFDDDTRANLLATLPADAPSGEGPLVLLCHTDVVPAQAEEWDHPPFDAVVVGGALVGRGSLDMLSMCAIEALTLVALKDRSGRKRDLLFVAVGDEEVSSKGMLAAFLSWPQLATAEWALGEASYIADGALAEGEILAAVAVAEKGIFQFKLVTEGKSGHGSKPPSNASTVRLIHAVENVVQREDPLLLTGPTERMLGALGAGRGGIAGAVMQSPTLLLALGRGTLESEEATPLVHNTCALTRLEAGYKTNVIPATASATFDCRLLPGTTPAVMRDKILLAIDDPRVRLETILALPPLSSSSETIFFDVVAERIKREIPDAIVIPSLSRGFSDLHHFRLRGIHSYGFIPFVVRKDEIAAIHGKNERVPVDELARGLSRLVDISAALLEAPAQPR